MKHVLLGGAALCGILLGPPAFASSDNFTLTCDPGVSVFPTKNHKEAEAQLGSGSIVRHNNGEWTIDYYSKDSRVVVSRQNQYYFTDPEPWLKYQSAEKWRGWLRADVNLEMEGEVQFLQDRGRATYTERLYDHHALVIVTVAPCQVFTNNPDGSAYRPIIEPPPAGPMPERGPRPAG
jgi:hypothetical protein